MSITSTTARMAGLLYLIVVLCGIFSLAYVPSVIETSKDGATLIATIRSHEVLFRLGIAAGLICYTAFLLLPFLLYRLLAPFGQSAAIAMVALAAASVPIAFANMIYRINVLSLLGDEPGLAGLTTAALEVQILMSLESYWNGIFILKNFWGLWLLPLGWLLFRSQLIPRLFGVLLMAGCFGYLVALFGRLLVPEFTELPIARYISLPGSIGEIGTCLWLLIMGARERTAASALTTATIDSRERHISCRNRDSRAAVLESGPMFRPTKKGGTRPPSASRITSGITHFRTARVQRAGKGFT